jgi:N-acetyl-anhydromuramyl-L-alanine amidase AmpD
MPKFETDSWPIIKARDFKHVPAGRTVRVIVIHDMEAPETPHTAEDVAKYFQHPDYPSSAHVCVDSDSVVQCVMDSDVAYAAPGANADGIQIELAGYGNQTSDQWMDDYSKMLLRNGANVVAQYCLKYDIPVVHLTNTQLQGGAKGIVGHVQVSQVYKQSNHTDPGPNFPWLYFMKLVQQFYDEKKK